MYIAFSLGDVLLFINICHFTSIQPAEHELDGYQCNYSSYMHSSATQFLSSC